MGKILKDVEDCKRMALWRASEKGFTLIELTIVLLIGGILLSFMGSALMTYMKKSKINTTEFRMKAIREALDHYLTVNGHYPCATSRFLGPNDANFGQPVNADCMSAAGATGTSRVTLASGFRIRMGAVPTRILNLSDEFIADSWGNKFTYAVTEVLATKDQYQEDCGGLTIKDVNNNDITNADNMGHYTLISHGETGAGAYPAGASTVPTTACSATAKDGANCNNDGEFVSTASISEAPGSDFFDDYVYFQGQTKPVTTTVPDGTIAMFDTMGCPTGWSTYTGARGRFMVGGRNGLTRTMPLYELTPADPPQTATFDFTPGIPSDGDHEANMPAYIPVNYCQKDPVVQPACRSYAGMPTTAPLSCPATAACPTLPPACSPPPPPPSGGKVLCGHYYNRGILSERVYQGDLTFGLNHVEDSTKRGYRLWAVPLTKYLNENPNGLVEKIVQPFVVGWAEEMAYRTGYHYKGNWIGKVEITIAAPVARVLGLFVQDTSWEHLASEQEIQQKHNTRFVEGNHCTPVNRVDYMMNTQDKAYL